MNNFFDKFRRYPELRTGIVNLKSGTAFQGVIWGRRGGWLVIRQAALLQERGVGAPKNENGHFPGVDGEVLVPMDEVDFVQVL